MAFEHYRALGGLAWALPRFSAAIVGLFGFAVGVAPTAMRVGAALDHALGLGAGGMDAARSFASYLGIFLAVGMLIGLGKEIRRREHAED